LETELVFLIYQIFLIYSFFQLVLVLAVRTLAGAIRRSPSSGDFATPPHTVTIAVIEAGMASSRYTIAVVKSSRLLVAVVQASASTKDEILF